MKSYTVEELKKLKEEWTQDKQTKTYDFLELLSEKQKADDLHPIAKIIGNDVSYLMNFSTGDTTKPAIAISEVCKKHDLRLWPVLTNKDISVVDMRIMSQLKVMRSSHDISIFLTWLRDTFAVPAKGKE